MHAVEMFVSLSAQVIRSSLSEKSLFDDGVRSLQQLLRRLDLALNGARIADYFVDFTLLLLDILYDFIHSTNEGRTMHIFRSRFILFKKLYLLVFFCAQQSTRFFPF